MTFRQFALKNVLRNKRIYVAYFLSSLFTVTVFFTFANFAFHPSLSGEDINRNVTLGMLLAGGIIYVFSFFFILYSMNAFLNSRKKEFGVLLLHGMSNKQVRRMVFLENMFIGFFATVFGIGIGFLFSKVILLIAENVLVMEESLNFYFPGKALALTFVSFISLFFIISILISFILRTRRLIHLIKGGKKHQGEPRASFLLTLLAILLIAAGYTIAILAKGPQVITALLPVVALVIVGSYFLFTQLSVFALRRLKERKGLFWKGTNMLLLSDLTYRMKDNARSFFMVAIISTVTFSAIGTLIGFNSFLTKGLKETNPISFTSFEEDIDHYEKIKSTFEEHHLDVKEERLDLTYFEEEDGYHRMIISPESYNKIAELIGEETIEIAEDDFIAVSPSKRNILIDEFDVENLELTLNNQRKIQINKELTGIAKPDIIPEMDYYFIAGSEVYQELGEAFTSNPFTAWHVIEGAEEDKIEAGRQIQDINPLVFSIDYTLYDIRSFWSPVMLVGLFIGIVFFVSAGSFLYFRLFTDLAGDQEKFSAIGKIGLTKREMRKVMGRQITLLFFLPIVVAMIHGAIALTALSNMFNYDLTKESLAVLASFLLIQIIYYLVVRFFYTRQVEEAVYR